MPPVPIPTVASLDLTFTKPIQFQGTFPKNILSRDFLILTTLDLTPSRENGGLLPCHCVWYYQRHRFLASFHASTSSTCIDAFPCVLSKNAFELLYVTK
jgi:hypothetical protein